MIELDREIEIDVPRESAFDFVADPETHLQFTPSLMDVEHVESADVGYRGEYAYKMVGTRATGTFEDTVFERPERRRYDLHGDLEGYVDWQFESTDGGTRVRYVSELEAPGPDVLDVVTETVAQRFSEREVGTTLENLKSLLEEQQAEA